MDLASFFSFPLKMSDRIMTTKVTVEKESDSEMQDINQQRVITEVQVKLLFRITKMHITNILDQKSGTRFSRPSRGQIQV